VFNALLDLDLSALPENARVHVFDENGFVGGAGPRAAFLPGQVTQLYEEASRIAQNGAAAADLSAAGDTRLIVAAVPFQAVWGGEGLVVVSLPTAQARAAGTGLLGVLLISAVIGLALAVIVGLALGSWLGGPLRRLAQAARNMAGGSYAQPVEGRFSGELYDLAAAMESMRREVRRSEQSLRGFVASAAHELRTPLTSIEGFSQALLDGTAATEEEKNRSAAAIFREAGRLRRLVDALLTLSRFDSREYRPNLVRFQASGLVEEEIARLVDAGLADPGRVRLTAEGDTAVTTDPDMLRQVMANLLKNAVQYGGQETVEARVSGRPRSLEIRVTNGGPALTAGERARVFERFFRGQSHSRTEGFGLGLPLVREILEVLGGSVALENGAQTTFLVSLPREPVTG
jgi:signal transduction histidine kinase